MKASTDYYMTGPDGEPVLVGRVVSEAGAFVFQWAMERDDFVSFHDKAPATEIFALLDGGEVMGIQKFAAWVIARCGRHDFTRAGKPDLFDEEYSPE